MSRTGAPSPSTTPSWFPVHPDHLCSFLVSCPSAHTRIVFCGLLRRSRESFTVTARPFLFVVRSAWFPRGFLFTPFVRRRGEDVQTRRPAIFRCRKSFYEPASYSCSIGVQFCVSRFVRSTGSPIRRPMPS